MKPVQNNKSSDYVALVVVFSVLALQSNIAVAQEDSEPLDEVIVTGSLIKRTDQRDLASPLKTIGAVEIDEQGAKDFAAVIRNLTINSGAELLVSGLNQPQTAGTSNINLRGLGLNSTLVLINGQRQTLSAIAKQSDGSSFVDTNSLVPMIMVERIDVLKDGAAATYGTDAVAGVVNFHTYKKFDGTKLSIDYMTETGDGSYDDTTISFMHGGSTQNANYVLAGSFKSSSVLEAGDRDWADGTAISSLAHPGGYSTSSGLQADPDCGANGTFPAFGGILCGMDITPFFDLMPEEDRLSLAANLTYNFEGGTTGFFEATYSQNDGETRATPSYPILRNFPVVSALDPANPFGEDVAYFGRVLGPEGVPTVMPFEYKTGRLAMEFDGDAFDDWSWSLAANYSWNDADAGNADTVVSRLEDGLAGVGGPGGDETYSPFFAANVPLSLKNYLMESSYQRGESSLTTVQAILTGDIADTKSGPIGAAIGMQYRNEELEVDLDDILNADNFYTLPGGDDFSADRDVVAVFAELAVPLGTDFELQLAGRYESYGSDLDTFDPKIAALWTPSDSVSVRGSFGTSFRAPSLLQSNGRLGSNDVITDSFNGLSGLFRPVSTLGNENLDPEEADVFNFGLTLTPSDAFTVSVDYWKFDYSNLLVKESSQGLVDQAILDFNNGLTDTEALTKVVRVGTTATEFGFITQINSDFINAPAVDTDGVDFSAMYVWDTNSGRFELGTEWTFVLSYDIVSSSAAAETDGAGSRNGTNFARPILDERGNVSFAWQNEGHELNLFGRYLSAYRDDAAGDVTIDSQTTVDLRYAYTFGHDTDGAQTRLTIGGINILDEDPPAVSTFIGFDVQTHDPRGRLVYLNLSRTF